ncbi:hypothetical protein DFH09DRAFT_123022 [Mycena vulgaris]|nr:hypothetical protein DFH09DRAFT_123022 [Mycena vulgaris]
MFRKFSKSAVQLSAPPSKASAAKSPAPNYKDGDRLDEPWPRKRLDRASESHLSAAPSKPSAGRLEQPWPRRLDRTSDSNLPSSRRNDTGKSPALKLVPRPNAPYYKERRPRRSTIAGGQSPLRPAVSAPALTPPPSVLANATRINRRIVEYMPELYEDVDPIRVTGKFYTWDDPSWLGYVPLPPPPRKNAKCGRLATKPRLDVCSSCSAKRSFSCKSAQYEPDTPTPLASELPTA